MMNPPERRSEPNRVTLEELLRVKRAERPSAEFWSRFEQDLRAKQLAAIIEPRPWWLKLRLPQVARTVGRYQMPVGAAAALALGFIVVREYRPAADTAPDVAVSASIAQPAETVVAAAGPAASPVEVASISAPVAAVPSVAVASVETTSSVYTADPSPVGPGALLAMIPWAAPQQSVDAETASPAPALGELPQVYFASEIKPTREHHFEGSVEVAPMLVSAPVEQPATETEPVAEVLPVSPREVRRNHILSSLVVADNSSDSDRAVLVQAREVVANSLTDDRLYDSVRRLGMGGDRLTLKF